ncbi:PH domain-containing protein [Tundrisphaera lichenicola]|uniref:PH domain-containing protein n=1 Tax=Tundrisphaera lichenicola TaxID=2029860 RepID=UPI003EB82BD0
MARNEPGLLGAVSAATTNLDPVVASNSSGETPVDPSGNFREPEPLYPQGVPNPQGTVTPTIQRDAPMSQSNLAGNSENHGESGVEGEVLVWETTYSMKNFVGRIVGMTLLSLAWTAFAIYTWGMGHENHSSLTWAAGALLAILWVSLMTRLLRARFSHYYRLTNRRLFVSTGIFNRRRDMMELLSVKDVFTRQQSLTDRWLELGTVVVVPNEKETPTFYLPGVEDPKQVMDLIWHQSRTERDHRTIKVDSV